MTRDESDRRHARRQAELNDVVDAIVVRHGGRRPTQIAPQGGGLSSEAFEASAGQERFIVRLGPRATKLPGFERERRAVEGARAFGVPTQEILGVGIEGAWAYSIAHRLAGALATDHPKRTKVLRELGAYSAIIHRIPTVGYGCAFAFDTRVDADECDEDARRAQWLDFLHRELHVRDRLEHLERADMLLTSSRASLNAWLDAIEQWDTAPVLNHGDLRLKNVIVDEPGRIIGIIDWETSVSSIGPHWDFSVALHDLGIDAKQAFLEGYGLDESDIRRDVHVWRLFNILNYAPTLTKLLERGDARGVDRLRTRLHGALDLHSA